MTVALPLSGSDLEAARSALPEWITLRPRVMVDLSLGEDLRGYIAVRRSHHRLSETARIIFGMAWPEEDESNSDLWAAALSEARRLLALIDGEGAVKDPA